MQKNGKNYIPALKFDLLTPLYDPFMKIFMPEDLIKNALIEQAGIQQGYRVLDFGCGTATLSIMVKVKNPDAMIVGIDIDEKIIGIAKRKVANKGLDIEIDKYDGNTLPYKNESFDRVISSLVFHHLTRVQKENALKELYRVLKPDGELNIADFGKPGPMVLKAVSYMLQLFEPLTDNIRGLIPNYLKAAGFLDVKENRLCNTIFGTLVLYSAHKP